MDFGTHIKLVSGNQNVTKMNDNTNAANINNMRQLVPHFYLDNSSSDYFEQCIVSPEYVMVMAITEAPDKSEAETSELDAPPT